MFWLGNTNDWVTEPLFGLAYVRVTLPGPNESFLKWPVTVLVTCEPPAAAGSVRKSTVTWKLAPSFSVPRWQLSVGVFSPEQVIPVAWINTTEPAAPIVSVMLTSLSFLLLVLVPTKS